MATPVTEWAPREVPTLRALLREELAMVGRRWTQGKPWYTAVGWFALIIYFFADSRVGPLLPFWLGFVLGMAPWNNRLLGRSVGWELPVARARLNRVRVVTGLAWLLPMAVIFSLVAVFSRDQPWSGEAVAVFAASSGAGMLGFTGGFIIGQLTRARKAGVFLLGFVPLMLLGLLPTRFLLWILPSPFDTAIAGRFGLSTFSGKSLIERASTGAFQAVWSLDNWLISVAIWGTICLGLLFVISATHQE